MATRTPIDSDALAALLQHDPQAAFARVRDAAQAGQVEAQLLLAQMHMEGKGTTQDASAARLWYETAANNGAPMAINGQRIALFTIEMFFRWLVRHRVVQSNPAADLELPRRTDDLREPLTLAEMETVLALPELGTPEGLRDRAVLELFYATGIRRVELTNLIQSDIDRERGTLHVRRGKGKKDRFVPVGERALAWVAKYEREARPQQVVDPVVTHLFLNQYGQPLSPDGLSWRVRDYFQRAGIAKRGACHLFRHTMATAMLDNGADIRHVQEMLGHGQITSTQRYTHVSIARLTAVHAATHPAARLLRGLEEDGLSS